MQSTRVDIKSYLFAAFLGAVAGGFIVALVTKALPKLVSQVMAGMMQSMMAQMRTMGCNPSEM